MYRAFVRGRGRSVPSWNDRGINRGEGIVTGVRQALVLQGREKQFSSVFSLATHCADGRKIIFKFEKKKKLLTRLNRILPLGQSQQDREQIRMNNSRCASTPQVRRRWPSKQAAHSCLFALVCPVFTRLTHNDVGRRIVQWSLIIQNCLS